MSNTQNCNCHGQVGNCDCNKVVLDTNCAPCLTACGDSTVVEVSPTRQEYNEFGHKFNFETSQYEPVQKDKCCSKQAKMILPDPYIRELREVVEYAPTQDHCITDCEFKAIQVQNLINNGVHIPVADAPVLYASEADALAGITIKVKLTATGKVELDAFGRPIPLLSGTGDLLKNPANPALIIAVGMQYFTVLDYSVSSVATEGCIQALTANVMQDETPMTTVKCDTTCETC